MPTVRQALHAASATGPPVRAGARWWALGLPVGLSIAVHALLATALAAVAWRLASPAPEPAGGVEAFLAPETTAPSSKPEQAPPPTQAPETAIAERQGPRTTVVLTPSGSSAAPPPPMPSGPAASEGPGAPSGVGAALADPPAKGAGAQFGGLSASRARSVVFVVDGSGPMLGALPMLKASVLRSAGALIPVQQFGVIVFRDASADGGGGSEPAGVDIFNPRLLDATPRNLARLSDWLAPINAKGRSNPLDGLRAALALSPRPHIVFLLSRSIPRSHGGQWERGTDAILRELDALNPVDPAIGRRRTIIKTLQFLEPDPTGTMQAIAAAHGSAAAARGKGGAATGTEAATPDHRVLKLEELPR
jgi:hypothetical protein